MEQRLSVVTLAVADLASAASFYAHLGWTLGFQNDEVVFFQLNGVVLSLYRRDRLARDLGTDVSSLGPGGIVLAYNVRSEDEVAVVIGRAKDAGGTVLVPAEVTPWGGTAGYFADPDGHRWEVAWNPSWPIDADGDVTLLT